MAADALASLSRDRFAVDTVVMRKGDGPASLEAREIAVKDPDVLVDLCGLDAAVGMLLAQQPARLRITSSSLDAPNVAPLIDQVVADPNDLVATLAGVQAALPASDSAMPDAGELDALWRSAVERHRSGDRDGAREEYLRVLSLQPEFAAAQPHYDLYALGWGLSDYRGAQVVGHDGAVLGSQVTVALLPEKNVGIFIASNSEDGEIIRGLLFELLDHYLGYPQAQWPEKWHAFKVTRLNAAAKAVQTAEAKPVRIGPSLPLANYVGDYADPWYGTIKVRHAGKNLAIEFPHSTGMEGPLTHYQYDTFKMNPSLNWVEPAYVTFSIGADGKVDRVTMKPVSPRADFSWDYQDLLFTPATSKAANEE